MDEKQVAETLIEMDMKMKIQDDIKEISKYYEENNDLITQAFSDSIKKLLIKGKAMQDKNKKGSASILTVSFLRSFAMENDYRLRLDLYDGAFFMSKTECSEYLDAEFILKYMDDDINMLVNDLKECEVKFREYEIDELKMKYMDAYIPILQVFVKQNMMNILNLKEFKELKKNKKFKIIFGEYLDNTVAIYDSTSEREAE